MVIGSPVAGNVTGVDKTYRLNILEPPHIFPGIVDVLVNSPVVVYRFIVVTVPEVIVVVLVTVPVVLYWVTLPEQTSVQAPGPVSDVTAEPAKLSDVPP